MRVSVLLAALASLAFVNGKDRKFTLINQCSHTVWPGFQNSKGPPLISAEGSEQLMGFELADSTPKTIPVPETWSGRMWGRTGCKIVNGQFRCDTGNCEGTDANCLTGNQLATVAEFTLQTPGSEQPDNYDISLVDAFPLWASDSGFNLQMQIKPDKGCQELSCTTDINAICPKELQKDGGCVTACKAGISEGMYKNATGMFRGNRNCCSGPFDTPEYCPPEMNDYYWLFKDACPEAYAYAYDDHASLVTCDQTQQADYTITFCPTDASSAAGKKAAHSPDQYPATQICVPPTWSWVSWADKGNTEPVTEVCEKAKKNEAPPLNGAHTQSDRSAETSTSEDAPSPTGEAPGATKAPEGPAKPEAGPTPSKTGALKDSEAPSKTEPPPAPPKAPSGLDGEPVEKVVEVEGSGSPPVLTGGPSVPKSTTAAIVSPTLPSCRLHSNRRDSWFGCWLQVVPSPSMHGAAASDHPANGLPAANIKIPVPTKGAADVTPSKSSCTRNKKRGMKKRLLESRQNVSL
ncbi:hypothetical protein QFC22_005492 [Naganishia vaughanmartiniae]|uniref:Uncharacterized protein n=1 Tax=Naganishia vaughanmartiniae TaxID=1424756 RepID=A0ACC2WTW5_9TREE|nr:hypothetical protein QFC22_005492 [Naganishia vaughanmartiniae]